MTKGDGFHQKRRREKLVQVTSEIFLHDTPKEDDPWRKIVLMDCKKKDSP